MCLWGGSLYSLGCGVGAAFQHYSFDMISSAPSLEEVSLKIIKREECFHYGDLHFGGLSACMNEFLTLLALPFGFFHVFLFRHAVSTLILCLLTT